MVAKVFISWIVNNKVLHWTKLVIIVLVNRKPQSSGNLSFWNHEHMSRTRSNHTS
jgi:hypothetical protein